MASTLREALGDVGLAPVVTPGKPAAPRTPKSKHESIRIAAKDVQVDDILCRRDYRTVIAVTTINDDKVVELTLSGMQQFRIAADESVVVLRKPTAVSKSRSKRDTKRAERAARDRSLREAMRGSGNGKKK